MYVIFILECPLSLSQGGLESLLLDVQFIFKYIFGHLNLDITDTGHQQFFTHNAPERLHVEF